MFYMLFSVMVSKLHCLKKIKNKNTYDASNLHHLDRMINSGQFHVHSATTCRYIYCVYCDAYIHTYTGTVMIRIRICYLLSRR